MRQVRGQAVTDAAAGARERTAARRAGVIDCDPADEMAIAEVELEAIVCLHDLSVMTSRCPLIDTGQPSPLVVCGTREATHPAFFIAPVAVIMAPGSPIRRSCMSFGWR